MEGRAVQRGPVLWLFLPTYHPVRGHQFASARPVWVLLVRETGCRCQIGLGLDDAHATFCFFQRSSASSASTCCASTSSWQWAERWHSPETYRASCVGMYQGVTRGLSSTACEILQRIAIALGCPSRSFPRAAKICCS